YNIIEHIINIKIGVIGMADYSEKKLENILIIDDEVSIRNLLERRLSSRYSVQTAEDGDIGIKKVREGKFAVVIVDIKLPGMDGHEVLKEIKNIDKDIEVIMITGYATMEAAVKSLRDGAFDFINKPFDIRELESRIAKAVDSHHSRKTIVLLNEGLKETYIELEKLKDSLEEKVLERTEELTKSEKKFRSIIDGSFDAIITINSKGEITSWNKGAEFILGYEEPEIAKKSFDILIAKDKEKVKEELLNEIKNKEFARNFITQFITKNSETIFVNITASAIAGNEYSMVIRDITREKKIDQMKTEFVSNVSHELRTPLTAIKGSIELLLAGAEGPITDSQKEFLNITRNNSVRLIRLISELLDLSKIEAGKIKMEIKPGDIVKTIKETISEFKPLAEKQEINIEYDGPDQVPRVLFDEDKIKQVLTNLIGNAIKFTPENGIVTVLVNDKKEDVIIGIRDTGMGIARDNFHLVFEKFQQVDGSSTRAKGGTGLGLAIAKSIVGAHKGRIWVESEMGKGSTFSFEIPKADKKFIETIDTFKELQLKAQAEQIKGAPFTVKRILVIDDDYDMVEVLKQHLERKGYEVVIVQNSRDALKTAIDTKPNLITLDLLMPNIDGFTIAELLKQNPVTKDIPIVIISAIFEKERAYKLGIADYITKPFEPSELFDSITKVETQITGEMSKKKILVVDDDPDISSVLALTLNEKNYTVLNAYDGLQAVATAKKEKPDMIILDLMLPEMDGFDVIKKIKSDNEILNIPIIVITGRGAKDKEKAIKLGAKEYLLKPFSMKTLLDELDSILGTVPNENQDKQGIKKIDTTGLSIES
ncbi:MAG: response regulator, partial [Endomicrobiales bacterium]|nr:response regulator [Endomicrobiales bacterium]